MNPRAKFGRLLLIPNTLDLGTFGDVKDGAVPPDLQHTLPLGALQAAAGLRHWVAENARSARALLKRVHAIVPLCVPLQEIDIRELPRPPKGGRHAAPKQDWDALLTPAFNGHDVGLVSEAGLPAVADPGSALVRQAHLHQIAVLPLSGPSSLMLALAASGLNGQSFAFVGYLPTDAPARAQKLRELERHSRLQQQTQLLIETPYRNAAVLAALLEGLSPTTWLSISVGLTLQGGWTRTLTIEAWRTQRLELPASVPAVFSFLA